MIARHCRGWPLSGIEGYRGGYILRDNGPREVEFVVINLFDSLDAVKRFAGRADPVAMHYEVRASTAAA
jgi:heme-degrading monooxygenase HmoA